MKLYGYLNSSILFKHVLIPSMFLNQSEKANYRWERFCLHTDILVISNDVNRNNRKKCITIQQNSEKYLVLWNFRTGIITQLRKVSLTQVSAKSNLKLPSVLRWSSPTNRKIELVLESEAEWLLVQHWLKGGNGERTD